MKNVTGIILAYDSNNAMRELTHERTVASIPFGGRYRLIDFVLSNLVNSGVRDVSVVTKSNYYSLMDHLGSGKEWDLNRKKGGLSILPPSISSTGNAYSNPNKIEALNGIIDYIRDCESKYIIVSDANLIANINYKELLEFHKEKHAYMTVVYQKDIYDPSRFKDNTFLEINEDGRVVAAAIDQSIQLYSNLLLGTFIIERELLEFLISQCAAHNCQSFERDIIQQMCKDLDIYGYCYDAYTEKIDSVETFRKANMDLLNPEIRKELFGNGAILTKVRDEVPTYYSTESSVSNSLVADGCIIEGKVENSIIFRGVKIGKGVSIKDSIVMQDTVIEQDATLDNCIVDKMVTVSAGKTLIGAPSYPVVLAKKSVI